MPSEPHLRELEEQIHTGYVRGIHKALDRIAASEPGAEAFVQRLRQMAKGFQLDLLASAVGAALAQQASKPGGDGQAAGAS